MEYLSVRRSMRAREEKTLIRALYIDLPEFLSKKYAKQAARIRVSLIRAVV